MSCEQLAKEQKQDETLKGCFKLAALGKGQFKIKDGLLYHTQTILNREHESWWYLSHDGIMSWN